MSAAVLPGRWAQLPGDPVDTPDRRSAVVAATVMAALVVAVPPTTRAVQLHGAPRGIVVAVVAAVAAGLLRWWRSTVPPSGRPSVVAAALLAAPALVTGWVGGRVVGLSVATGVVVLLSVDGPDVAGRPAMARLRPLVGVCLLAAVVAVRTDTVLFVGVQLLGLVVTSSLVGDGVLERIDRVVRRIVDVCALVVLRVSFVVIGLVVVLVPWLATRLVRWDPTWFRRPEGTRFVTLRVDRADARDAARQWRSPVDARPAGWRRAAHRAVLVATVLLLVGGVALATSGTRAFVGDRGEVDDLALANSPWWSDASKAQSAVWERATLTAFVGPVLADVRSEWTNVVDGRRVTWQPPERPTVTVWFFGGSTAFGFGQRDDHTIPSEIAQLAWADGLAVDVVNWGVHGDVHWMEWNRLRAALTAGMTPPDLVVFYDGFNDLTDVVHLSTLDRTAGRTMVGSLDMESLDSGDLSEQMLSRFRQALFDPGIVDRAPVATRSRAEVADAAVRQYGTSVDTSQLLLADLGIPAAFYYQPSRMTRATPVDGEGTEPDDRAWYEHEFRSRLPEGVVDLSGALDDTDEPVYWDSVHTNELGTRVIAAAMYVDLEQRLRDLDDASGGS